MIRDPNKTRTKPEQTRTVLPVVRPLCMSTYIRGPRQEALSEQPSEQNARTDEQENRK